MGLKFIFGRAGTGKSTFCIREIQERVENDPLGNPIILLVPEQSTFQMEQLLTAQLGGTMRCQVLSFHRLCWKVFSEVGGGQKVLLGDMGKGMLIRKILLENKEKFRVFAHSVERPGMADLFAKTIGELKIYGLKPHDLLKENIEEELKHKLDDLYLVYSQFEERLGSAILDPSDELQLLAEKIPRSKNLFNASIWIDGFKGFTPQEFEVLKNLMLYCKEMTITLPIDPSIIERSVSHEDMVFLPGEEIFYDSYQTYLKLSQLAFKNGISIEQTHSLKVNYRQQNPCLNYLEQYCFSYGRDNSLPFESSIVQEAVRIRVAGHRRKEIEGVACEIRKLIREQGYRWNDISIMTRDLNCYYDLINKIFTNYEIPYFIDYKEPIIHHPLIELIISILELAEQNWSYEPLFRSLKTNFFPLHRDEIDRLENYCLAYGIDRHDWVKEQAWDYGKENKEPFELRLQEKINNTRTIVRNLIQPFIEQSASAQNVREITESLYSFLVSIKVPQTLSAWAQRDQEEGKLTDSLVHRQVWQSFISLCDELVMSIGEESLSLADYRLILSTGLENLDLALIPPRTDQVLIGQLNRSRNPEVKVLFLIGANEGILPPKPDKGGLFDEEERLLLEKAGIELSPKGIRQIYEEEYYIYTGVTRSREKLYLSYSLADEEGKSLYPSRLIKRVKHLFPEIEAEEWFAHEIDYISHPKPLLNHYAAKIREKHLQSRQLWHEVGNYLSEHAPSRPVIELIKKGLSYNNQERKIPSVLAKKLYGRPLVTSVSRLEMFNRCPFAHYAYYGLKLKERKIQTFSHPDIGQFFHDALYNLTRQINEKGLDWGNLTKEEIWSLVDQIGDNIAPRLQSAILLSKARYRYLTYKLKKVVANTATVLGEHAKRGTFKPIRIEAQFGTAAFPGLNVNLSDGNTLMLQGRIDRIDMAEVDEKIYLRVIDYKSHETKLSLDNFYYGLNLQLITYLHVALNGAEILLKSKDELSVRPAGILYFPVVEPLIKEDHPVSDEEAFIKQLKSIRVDGYLLADQQVLEAMDREIRQGASDLLRIKLKRDGGFTAQSKVLNQEQFELLRHYLQKHLQAIGEKIMRGDISIAPYRKDNSTACTYCKYKPLCAFDPAGYDQTYRNLPPIHSNELWEKLKSDLQANVSQPFKWLGEGEDSFEPK